MELKDLISKQWKYLGGVKKVLYVSSVTLPTGLDSIYPDASIELYNGVAAPYFCHKKQLYVFINQDAIFLLDASMEIRGTMRIKTKDGMIEVVR